MLVEATLSQVTTVATSSVNVSSPALPTIIVLMTSCVAAVAGDEETGEEMGHTAGYQWPMLALFGIVLTTVSGNVLVCLAVYKEPKMRSMFNCFLVSLAVSDVLSACLVMPLSIIKAFAETLPLPKMMCIAWYSLDVLFTSSTIIHLCMISIDRYMSLTNPLRYGHSRKTKHFVARIALVWVISACIAGPLFLLSMIDHPDSADEEYKGCGPETPVFVISATMASFYVPLAIMAVMYVLTVRALHHQRRGHARIALTQSVPSWQRCDLGEAGVMGCEADASSGFVSPSPWSSPETTRREIPHTPAIRVTSMTVGSSVAPMNVVRPSSVPKNSVVSLDGCGGEYCRTTVMSVGGSATLTVPLERHLCGTPPLRRNVSNSSSASSLGMGRDLGCARSAAFSSSSIFHCRSHVSDTDTDSVGHAMSCQKGNGSVCNNNNGMRRWYGGGSRQSVASASDACGATTGSDAGNGNGRPRRLLLRRKTPGDSSCIGGSSRESALSRASKGRKAVQVIGILFAAFIMFYLPFFAAYLLRGTCVACRHYVTPAIITAFEWLAYSGSMVNPIIYHMFNPDFRRAFQRLLRCRRR